MARKSSSPSTAQCGINQPQSITYQLYRVGNIGIKVIPSHQFTIEQHAGPRYQLCLTQIERITVTVHHFLYDEIDLLLIHLLFFIILILLLLLLVLLMFLAIFLLLLFLLAANHFIERILCRLGVGGKQLIKEFFHVYDRSCCLFVVSGMFRFDVVFVLVACVFDVVFCCRKSIFGALWQMTLDESVEVGETPLEQAVYIFATSARWLRCCTCITVCAVTGQDPLSCVLCEISLVVIFGGMPRGWGSTSDTHGSTRVDRVPWCPP